MVTPPLVNAYVDGDRIVLVERKQGKRLIRSATAEWVAYLRSVKVSSSIERGMASSSAIRMVKRESEWIRVGFLGPEARRMATGREGYFSHHGLEHFEGDVDPVRRYLTDNAIEIAKPRRCYLDLETDSRVPFARKEEARILTWSVSDDETKQIVGWGCLPADTDAAEAELVGKLWEALEPYDQVLAWNGDGFDFPVIGARSDVHRLRADPRLWLWLDHLLLFEKMNKHSAESGDEKRSMKLDSIAQAVLGEGKDNFDARKTWEAWEAGGESRERLVRYNHKDTLLLPRIEAKKGYATLFDTIAHACTVFPDTSGLSPTRQVDAFMLKLGLKEGVHFPTRVYREETTQQFKGAQVVKPKLRGIGRNVHVCDFTGMYPSIMLTWNISPETLLPQAPVNGPIAPDSCRCPTTGETFRTNVQGLLTTALRVLIKLRKYSNDLKASLPPGSVEWAEADARSTAYKVVTNAFYGVIGNAFSRYFDWRIAESVTQNGVWLIRQTISAIEDRGWMVVYSDTDSAMVTGCTRQEFEDFTKWCNEELYPPLIAKQGCVENHIKIAYEKEFDRIVFSSAKRYVGRFAHYKGKAPKPMPALGEPFDPAKHSLPEVKGLEFKRGDASVLAAELQERVIHMLMTGEERISAYEDVTEETLIHVLNDTLPLDEVQQSAALTKGFKEYKTKVRKDGTVSIPTHVQVAKILEERGRQVVGQRIEWVVVDATASPMKVIPAEDYAGECDRYYVWENRTFPPTQRLLEAAFPDHSWRRLEALRPSKGRHKPAPKNQTTFNLPEEKTKARIPPRFSSSDDGRQIDLPTEPWELHLGESDDMDAIRTILSRFPGARPVRPIVHVLTGRAILESQLKVDGSPALEVAIDRSRADAWYAALIHARWQDVS